MAFYWNRQDQLVPAATLDASVIGAILSARSDKGLWLNMEPFSKFGFSDFVDNSFLYDLWAVDSYEHLFYRDAAVPAVISSTDANDTAGGTGAATVEIFYLDGDYNRQVQIATLNGLAPVSLAENVQSIYRMKVITGPAVGDSRRGNIGTIAVIDTSGPHIVASIPPDLNQTEMTHYTVPAEKIAVLVSVGATPTSAPTYNQDVFLFERPFRESGDSVFRAVWSNIASDASGQIGTPQPPLNVFREKTDLVMRAIATSAGARPVFGSYDLLIMDAA